MYVCHGHFYELIKAINPVRTVTNYLATDLAEYVGSFR